MIKKTLILILSCSSLMATCQNEQEETNKKIYDLQHRVEVLEDNLACQASMINYILSLIPKEAHTSE